MNVVYLQGRLSSDPVLRELSSGSRLLSLEVTTVDRCRHRQRAGRLVRSAGGPRLGAGVEVVVRGVVKRRFYRSAGGHAEPHRGRRRSKCASSASGVRRNACSNGRRQPSVLPSSAGYAQPLHRHVVAPTRAGRETNLEECRGPVHPARRRCRVAVEPCVRRRPARAVDAARPATFSTGRWSGPTARPRCCAASASSTATAAWPTPATCRSCPSTRASSTRPRRRSRPTRCTSIRRTSSSWPSKAAATPSPPPSACSVRSAASTPTASRSSSRSTTTSC